VNKIKTKEEYSKIGKASKRKGNKFEYDLTRFFLSKRFDADKVSGSGASTHRKGDVRLSAGYFRFNFDAKHYSKIGIFRWWDKHKKDVERTFIAGLITKEDYSDILVSIKLEDFADICIDLEELKRIKENEIQNQNKT
jgi:hypothetical protein